MITVNDKNKDRVIRHKRVRKHLSGTSERPRLNVYKSLNHIYAQIIDDDAQKTLAYATTVGSKITGTMTEWEQKLGRYHFVRCNACYLVNLGFVSELYGEYVVAGGHELRISRSKKQSFLSEFAKYAGGSK